MNLANIEITVEKQWGNGTITLHQLILPIEQIRYITEENTKAIVILTNDECLSTNLPYQIVADKYHRCMRFLHDPSRLSLY